MIDLIFDFVVEALVDNLVDITLSVIPENKHSKKLERYISTFIVFITLLFFILFVIGVAMITKNKGENALGKVFICLMPIQLLFSISLHIIKKLKAKKH